MLLVVVVLVVLLWAGQALVWSRFEVEEDLVPEV